MADYKDRNQLACWKNKYWEKGSRKPRLNTTIWLTRETIEQLAIAAREDGQGAKLVGALWRREGDNGPVYSGDLQTEKQKEAEKAKYARSNGSSNGSSGGNSFDDEEVPF